MLYDFFLNASTLTYSNPSSILTERSSRWLKDIYVNQTDLRCLYLENVFGNRSKPNLLSIGVLPIYACSLSPLCPQNRPLQADLPPSNCCDGSPTCSHIGDPIRVPEK